MNRDIRNKNSNQRWQHFFGWFDEISYFLFISALSNAYKTYDITKKPLIIITGTNFIRQDFPYTFIWIYAFNMEKKKQA